MPDDVMCTQLCAYVCIATPGAAACVHQHLRSSFRYHVTIDQHPLPLYVALVTGYYISVRTVQYYSVEPRHTTLQDSRRQSHARCGGGLL
jgi:hypothetical protein